jgi:hypothetical protein
LNVLYELDTSFFSELIFLARVARPFANASNCLGVACLFGFLVP